MRSDDEHVDDDVLTLLALGEDAGTEAERAHVSGCARCAAEVAALADVAALARPREELVPPAPHVWDAVASELGLAPAPAVPAVPAAPEAVQATEEPSSERSNVVPLAPRRQARWRWVAAGAAAGLVMGAAITWGVDRLRAPDVVATATLEPLPGWTATGSAEVETRSDGSRVLVVDLEGDVGSEGFREVWLLRPDVSGLVSVGTLGGTSGRFDLPTGLDLDEFSVVDVSEEQFDGDPAHSGDSIVRGDLRA